MKNILSFVFALCLLTVNATTFTVTNNNNSGAGSLRQAITDANADVTATEIAPHIINATAVADTIKLASALPNIDNHITINGSTTSYLTVSGENLYRVFFILPHMNVTLNNIKITNGYTLENGGGIENIGTITLNNCTISNCYANGSGGGIINEREYNYNFFSSSSILKNCSLLNNNSASGGGAMYSDGSLLLKNCLIDNNSALEGGGISFGINAYYFDSIINCSITNNVATDGSGGGIYRRGNGRLFVTNSNVSNNRASITSLASLGNGGGIFYRGDGLEIYNCEFDKNFAISANGQVGGALYVNAYRATIEKSTFYGNKAMSGGAIENKSTLTINNCTFSGDTAINGNGGGFDMGGEVGYSSVLMNNCTFYGCHATVNGGGFYTNDYSVLANNLIVGNTASYGNDIVGTVYVARGNNLIGDSIGLVAPFLSFLEGNLYGFSANRVLNTSLANNGGFNKTHALIPCSPAINAGYDIFTTDQRDSARVGISDIGAYEAPLSITTAAVFDYLDSGLIANYPFSGNANDASGNATNIITKASLIADRFGNKNSAYNFNGNDNYIHIEMDSLLLKNEYSFSFWVNPRSTPPSASLAYPLLIQGVDGGSLGVSIYNTSFPYFGWNTQHYFGGYFLQNPVASNALPDVRKWYHVAVTAENSTLKMYINGQIIGISLLLSPNNWQEKINKLFIGDKFDGFIDDIRIYNRAISACEVNALYTYTNSVTSYTVNPTAPICASTTYSLVIQPDGANGKDALLMSAVGQNDVNRGSNAQFLATAWMSYGAPSYVRSTLQFDLTAIPTAAIITEAKLSLYSWDSNGGSGQHSTTPTASNAAWLQRITSNWNEGTVTWNNQPSTTSENQIELAQSTSTNQDYLNINVSSLVQDMLTNGNYGFMFSMQSEQMYRKMNFASSDHANPALRPKIEIKYVIPVNSIDSITLSDPQTICAGNNVNLSVLSNSTIVSYLWNTGATTQTLNVAPIGTSDYSVSTINQFGCKGAGSVKVFVNPSPSLNVTSIDATCSSNGFANAIASGGISPYYYLWSNAKSSKSINNLSVGNYSVTVTDARGCNKLKSVTINQNNNGNNTLNGLLASYPFNGNANDATGNGHNGIVNGSTLTADRFGNANSAYNFNNSYISIAPDSFLLKKSYSYSTWVKPTTIPSLGKNSDIICIGASNTGHSGLSLSNKIAPYTYTGWVASGQNIDVNHRQSIVQSNSQVTPNIWYHVVITRDVFDFKLYINGQLIGSDANNGVDAFYGTLPPTITFEIGRGRIFTTISPYSYFNGSIDDVKIYNRAISSCEVNTLFNEQPTVVNTCTVTIAGSNQICFGNSLNLSAVGSGASSYLWSNGSTAQSISVSPQFTSSYSVSAVNELGCKASSSITVFVNSVPSAIVSYIDAICAPNGSANAVVSGGTIPYTYQWSNNHSTQSINSLNAGNYVVNVTDANGCNTSASANISFISCNSYSLTPICMVSVDDATNKNRVVWNKPVTNTIDSFIVYKEGNQAGLYAPIGSQPYAAFSTFTDVNSNPLQQANLYKLATKFKSGVVSDLSSFHKTIHLSISQGMGSWNLIWNHYEGFDFLSYNIYRGTSSNNMELLTTISASLNSYTDVNPPAGLVYYQIEVINTNGCFPSAKNGDYSSSKSNVASNNATGINESSLSSIAIYPNPSNGLVNINFSNKVGNANIKVVNIHGQVVYSEIKKNSVDKTTSIDLSEQAKGIYFVTIVSDTESITQKIVLE